MWFFFSFFFCVSAESVIAKVKVENGLCCFIGFNSLAVMLSMYIFADLIKFTIYYIPSHGADIM